MKWHELFPKDRTPSGEDVRAYIGEGLPLWDELTGHIEKAYRVRDQMTYSACPAQPGWNVKYKKSGKALCTLYPMEGYFVALVVVGPKEENEVGLGMEAGLFSPGVKELYARSSCSAMGRWLMIEVKDPAVLKDVRRLLGIRLKPEQEGI